jgi:hypothetical protein
LLNQLGGQIRSDAEIHAASGDQRHISPTQAEGQSSRLCEAKAYGHSAGLKVLTDSFTAAGRFPRPREDLNADIRKKERTMKSHAHNYDVDARWGVERWENEGGRVRYGAVRTSRLSRPADASLWARDWTKNAGDARLIHFQSLVLDAG